MKSFVLGLVSFGEVEVGERKQRVLGETINNSNPLRRADGISGSS